MEKNFELIYKQKENINELKNILESIEHKIEKIKKEIEILNDNYHETKNKISELNKYKKEEDTKEITSITISTIVYISIMILMIYNSFNFSLIKIIEGVALLSVLGFIINVVTGKIIKSCFNKKRKNEIKEIEDLNNNILNKKIELDRLNEQKKLIISEIHDKEIILEKLKNDIKEKCIPILDELILKEIELSSDIESDNNLMLIRKV